jgi:hypothetical protein
MSWCQPRNAAGPNNPLCIGFVAVLLYCQGADGFGKSKRDRGGSGQVQVDDSITIVTAIISMAKVIATPTNHGRVRRVIKPVSATISKTAIISSAIKPKPSAVIMMFDRQRGRGRNQRPLLSAGRLPHTTSFAHPAAFCPIATLDPPRSLLLPDRPLGSIASLI